MELKNMAVGQVLVVEADAPKMVKNPNPNGRKELVTEKSAEEYKQNHGTGIVQRMREANEQNKSDMKKHDNKKDSSDYKAPGLEGVTKRINKYANM